MFLVKWAGLGYEYCTWETREDVNDDRLIQKFRRRNSSFPDEPDLEEETLMTYIGSKNHLNVNNAGGDVCLSTLRSQLYAQCRSYQFIKFGENVPQNICQECGPVSYTISDNKVGSTRGANLPDQHHPQEVINCLYDIVNRVSRNQTSKLICSGSHLPPLMAGEYDTVIPITSKGLMMNVGEIHNSVSFLGYRKFPDGSSGPAEKANLVKNVGDKIIAVDGQSTVGKDFKSVIAMLRESGKNQYAYMRFLESRYTMCDGELASIGKTGRYVIDELHAKYADDRRTTVAERFRDGQSDTEVAEKILMPIAESKNDDDDDEEASVKSEGSEGEFEPDSDDDEGIAAKDLGETGSHEKEKPVVPSNTDEPPSAQNEAKLTPIKDKSSQDAIEKSDEKNITSLESKPGLPVSGVHVHSERTRSLALRLLDLDLDYSSDEGGFDDSAYFVDGTDITYESRSVAVKKELLQDELENLDDIQNKAVFAHQNEFTTLGERQKLASAIALTSQPPSLDLFDNFPSTSTSNFNGENDDAVEDAENSNEMNARSGELSNVKVEQVAISTGDVIHVWANIESASATLQLPLAQLKRVLKGDYDEEVGDEVGGYRWRYALSDAKVTAGSESSRGGSGRKAQMAWLEFRDKLYDPSVPHIYKNGNRLRDYQVDGVNWLASTWYKKQGCILADEMGLGKTVQIVCYIEHIFRVENIQRPFLVVVPLSTVEHWRREFEGWTEMTCCVYHDRQRVWRDVLREYEWYYEDRPHTAEFLKFDVLVTTYDTLIGDFDVISQVPFRVAVVDEAHRLRNQKGKLLECMREISAKGTLAYGFQSRVLMSGTPLQNDLTELWTLLNFIEPFKFPDLAGFQVSFGNMANREQVENLQRMISPYMLRRVKEDVAKDIPAKEETVIDVELTGIQKQYYRATFEHNLAFLNMGTTRQTAPKLMNIQMELRKVCNHPFLLDGVEHRETDRQYKEFSESGRFDGKSPEEQQHLLNEHGYIMTSGKMVLLDKLLPKLRQEGHKVLLFSQTVKMLDLISEYCELRSYKYERLDGKVRGTERQKSIDRFEREEDSFLFLLSTRAGGVGINLTAADICIIFDSDWNPQNDVQAQARCHRIGQTKDVRIYRLVTSRSFEQEMFNRASRKLGLEQAVLGTFEKDQDDDKPSQKEMEQLLKKGAYALLEDENDEITNEFCADDIDAILAKRTRTRVVEGAKTSSWLNKQGMMVTKQKFSSETGTDVLDMDDPLFWQKVMPDFMTPSLLFSKFNDLIHEAEGTKKGPGRGRGRWRKKKAEAEAEAENEVNISTNSDNKTVPEKKNGERETGSQDDNKEKQLAALLTNEKLEDLPPEEAEETSHPQSTQSRTISRKVQKFVSDLKSVMDTLADGSEDISAEEKDICQKLLLTMSVKDKIFSDEQRRLARKYLNLVEGDRRRRCRTTDQPQKLKKSTADGEPFIPEELRIVGKQRRRRRRRDEIEDSNGVFRRRRRKQVDTTVEELDEDGYLRHSDSDAEFSDVVEDIYDYSTTKREKVTRKESKRRRQWANDDDPATAAGRTWPTFPRHVVNDVLSTLLDKVIEHDKEEGAAFSSPVSKTEFPEYYDVVDKPMDYSTMKKKLANGEYCSAQSMQKDFILILQNCCKFNASTSDIVKEARNQHLLRPKLLRESAAQHNLFLAEDGSVLEITDEEQPSTKKANKRGRSDSEQTPKGRNRREQSEAGTNKSEPPADDETTGGKSDDKSSNNTPRIKIKVKAAVANGDGKRSARKQKSNKHEDSTTAASKTNEGKNGDAGSRKRSRRSRAPVNDEASEEESSEVVVPSTKRRKVRSKPVKESDSAKYLDLDFWVKSREALDSTFASARENFTQLGPWEIPASIPGEKFPEIAKAVLSKMDRHDRFSVFADEVTDKEAPGYSETVKNPMDFGKMKAKVASGEYGTGNEAAVALYEDFLLVFDNCVLFNTEESDVTDEAVRMFKLLPEVYASVCIDISKGKSGSSK